MKKKSVLLLFVAIAALANAAAQNEKQKNFMWEINSGGSKVYILGSIHAAREELYPLPDLIENAYKNSQNLVVEADISQADPSLMMTRMYYMDGTTLKDKVKPEVYAELESIFQKYSIPAIAYEKLKPWAAGMMAAQFEVERSGYEGSQGIDMYFMGKANEEGKKILELESINEQLELFEKIEELFGDEYLEISLKQMKDTTDYLADFFDAWKRGDTKKFEALYKEQTKDIPNQEKLDKYLMIERNYKMAEKVELFLKEGGTYFVVVGAGHLIGPESLINLLEKKKYKAKQL